MALNCVECTRSTVDIFLFSKIFLSLLPFKCNELTPLSGNYRHKCQLSCRLAELKILFFFWSNRLSNKSELTTNIITRSKLEHYGFNMLARPASLRLNKRQSLAKDNQTKKIRSNESRHSMQTRSQSSSVCFSKAKNRKKNFLDQ